MSPTEADPALAATGAAPATAGAALRQARESRGLHIAALAATLKVPQSKLEALEADRYQDLPDATFARALARSVCRVLKLDAEPILALLPRSGAEAALDRVTPGLNQPFRERAASQEPALSPELLKSPVMLGVAGLLLAALLVYAVPSSWIEAVQQRLKPASTTETAAANGEPVAIEAPGVPASGAAVTPDGAAQRDLTASQTGVATLPPQTSGEAAATGYPAVAAPSAATGTARTTAGNAVTASPTPATPGTTAPVATMPTGASTPVTTAPIPPGAAPLNVKVTAESWVEVVDARGQVLLSRLLRPGDQVDVNGVAPLKLRVGNVSGTALTFRGQAVDLAGRARDNVARLELN